MLVLIILALLLWSLVGDLCFFAIMTNIRDSELNSVEAFKYVYKTNRTLFFILSGPLVWIILTISYLYDINIE